MKQDTPVIVVQKKLNSNLWFTCIYGYIFVDAATCCPATKHQDRYTRKEHIKFHTFWTSELDEPLTDRAPSTQWIGESINMVTKRKICLCQESRTSHPDHSLQALT